MSTLHRHLDLNGLKIFYREAGRRDATVLLWLLESHFETVLPLIRDFLSRVHAPRS